MAKGRSIRETMASFNAVDLSVELVRHARRRRRAHGRGHAGGRRRRLPVLHAQRQPPHPGGDRGRADPRPAGSRPGAQEPTSTRSSATIFWRSDQPEQEGSSHHAQTSFFDAASAAAPPWGFWAPASPRRSSVRPARKPPGPRSRPSRTSLKGTGEVRIATFGGTMQEAQQRAYFEPFEKLSGIKVRAFPGSDPTKVKAMVETGNVEWDMAQLSRGSIMNLQKRGDYFEKIDYDIVDAGVDPPIASSTAWKCWCGRRCWPTAPTPSRAPCRKAGPISGTPRSSPAIAPWSAPAPAAGRSWSSR